MAIIDWAKEGASITDTSGLFDSLGSVLDASPVTGKKSAAAKDENISFGMTFHFDKNGNLEKVTPARLYISCIFEGKEYYFNDPFEYMRGIFGQFYNRDKREYQIPEENSKYLKLGTLDEIKSLSSTDILTNEYSITRIKHISIGEVDNAIKRALESFPKDEHGIPFRYIPQRLKKSDLTEEEIRIEKRNAEIISLIKTISGSGGGLDFGSELTNGETFELNTLGIIDGVAYDLKDGGNYMWGNAMSRLIPYYMAKVGSEIHAFLSGKSDNNGEPGYSWGGDSAADQRAIWNGYHYGQPPKKVWTGS